MNRIKTGKGVITEARNRINLCDKDNTKAGMEIMLDIENQMKQEKMRREITNRSKVVENKKVIDPVKLTEESKEMQAHEER